MKVHFVGVSFVVVDWSGVSVDGLFVVDDVFVAEGYSVRRRDASMSCCTTTR